MCQAGQEQFAVLSAMYLGPLGAAALAAGWAERLPVTQATFSLAQPILTRAVPPPPPVCASPSSPGESLGPSLALSAGACHRELLYLSPFCAYGNN